MCVLRPSCLGGARVRYIIYNYCINDDDDSTTELSHNTYYCTSFYVPRYRVGATVVNFGHIKHIKTSPDIEWQSITGTISSGLRGD